MNIPPPTLACLGFPLPSQATIRRPKAMIQAAILLSLFITTAGVATSAGPSRVEAESRFADAGACDGPEAMRVYARTDASAGQYLEFPGHLSCWAEWRVTFATTANSIVLGSIVGSASQPTNCVMWLIHVNGIAAGSSLPDCSGPDITRIRVIASSPIGTHVVRVTPVYLNGPMWANTGLDYLEVTSY